ncbi:hypothetical protein HYU13_05100 [Candidatus Woesearchaeota archaeon]|nr:hypothetical protein [Candidatus Woesearchaeota archaeon]
MAKMILRWAVLLVFFSSIAIANAESFWNLSDELGEDYLSYISPHDAISRIGIGIAQPVSPTTVFHTHVQPTNDVIWRMTNKDTGKERDDGVYLRLAMNNLYLTNFEEGWIFISTNNVARLVISPQGDVRIEKRLAVGGLFTPEAELHVNGTLRVDGTLLIDGMIKAGEAEYALPRSDGREGEVLATKGDGELYWRELPESEAGKERGAMKALRRKIEALERKVEELSARLQSLERKKGR